MHIWLSRFLITMIKRPLYFHSQPPHCTPFHLLTLPVENKPSVPSGNVSYVPEHLSSSINPMCTACHHNSLAPLPASPVQGHGVGVCSDLTRREGERRGHCKATQTAVLGVKPRKKSICLTRQNPQGL